LTDRHDVKCQIVRWIYSGTHQHLSDALDGEVAGRGDLSSSSPFNLFGDGLRDTLDTRHRS